MQSRSRAGFTLIELMVAMALTLFIMVILSQAFVSSLETFSQLKAIGDMQASLRTVTTLLRDDLAQDHFQGKQRLSDITLSGGSQILAAPPQEGFFAVRQSSAVGSAAYVYEGADVNNMPSYRAIDHYLYFTVKRKGNRQENFFTASLNGTPAVLGAFFTQQSAYNLNPAIDLPANTLTLPYAAGSSNGFYGSQWAEVVYYLVRVGSTEEPSNPASTNGLPTYSLYRAQFVMVQNGTTLNTQFPNAAALQNSTFAGMSCNPGTTNLTFYTPADAATGQRVIPDLTTFNAATNGRVFAGATLVLSNVVSFHTQVMPITTPFGTGNVNFQDIAPGSPGIYDTARFGNPGYANFGLKAIQVTLRVWDSKTRQTRQVSIVQDL